MKRTIVLGTGNPHKLKELQSLLRGSRIRVRAITDFKPAPKVVEDGRTFEANACKKARTYSRIQPYLTLADDSGLCVNALNGKPGVYSARFAGPGCTYADNNRKLLRLLGDRPASKRKAWFCSVIAMYQNGRRVKITRGICRGRIAHRASGKNGFGYDPVFVPQGFNKTYAELSPTQKNRISHRSRALRAVLRFLKTKKL